MATHGRGRRRAVSPRLRRSTAKAAPGAQEPPAVVASVALAAAPRRPSPLVAGALWDPAPPVAERAEAKLTAGGNAPKSSLHQREELLTHGRGRGGRGGGVPTYIYLYLTSPYRTFEMIATPRSSFLGIHVGLKIMGGGRSWTQVAVPLAPMIMCYPGQPRVAEGVSGNQRVSPVAGVFQHVQVCHRSLGIMGLLRAF